MAINEITYANKSDINTSSVPITNKITASDINEVKTVVNDNANLMGDLTNLSTTDNTSLVNAINEVNNNLAWTFLNSSVGSNAITLPATFNEILCIVKINNNDNLQVSITIPYEHLTTTDQGFNGGYLQVYNGNASMCRVIATKTSAHIGVAYLNGSSVLNASALNIYYR